jgi:hypothetical protein
VAGGGRRGSTVAAGQAFDFRASVRRGAEAPHTGHKDDVVRLVSPPPRSTSVRSGTLPPLPPAPPPLPYDQCRPTGFWLLEPTSTEQTLAYMVLVPYKDKTDAFQSALSLAIAARSGPPPVYIAAQPDAGVTGSFSERASDVSRRLVEVYDKLATLTERTW